MIVRVGQSVECVNTSTIAASVHNFPLKNQAMNVVLRPFTNPGGGMLWAAKREESLPIKIASDPGGWSWLPRQTPHPASRPPSPLEGEKGRSESSLRSTGVP